jgi:hypothetical protein
MLLIKLFTTQRIVHVWLGEMGRPMKIQLWSPELKTVIKGAIIFAPVVGITFCWPAHPYMGLSLGLCVGLFLSFLVPPRATIKTIVLSLIIAASSGPLYFLLHNFKGGWFSHTP